MGSRFDITVVAKDKDEAVEMLPKVKGLIDKLAKNNQIHKNKASNLKSKLTKFVNVMGATEG